MIFIYEEIYNFGEPFMIKMMDLITEGVYDKGIFKAVFMAGGPGSGKTYIKGQLFGIPES